MHQRESEALIAEWLGGIEPPELGPGPRPGVWPESQVHGLVQARLAGLTLPTETRRAVEALVLLWHDHLDTAHRIAQGLETPDGNFVHAIMHRREPDYWNSKYWWRRVGAHPCFPEIARRVEVFLAQAQDAALAGRLLQNGGWDAAAFVDACADAPTLPPEDVRVQRLRAIQRIETEAALAGWLARATASRP